MPIEVTNCRNLTYFKYPDNLIGNLPPQVQPSLHRSRYVEKIYNDVQSVHNHSIQQGVTTSINYNKQYNFRRTNKTNII